MGAENDPKEPIEPTPPAEPAEPKEPEPKDPEPAEPKGADGDVKDSHGQPGINKERHDKEVAELNAEIAKLKAEAKEAAENKAKREEYEKKAADLEAKMADSEITHKLEMAGCKNVKAAKALLDDYEGDVSKLKNDCPYLFGTEKQTGSTGKKPEGAPGSSEKMLEDARKVAGIRKKE